MNDLPKCISVHHMCTWCLCGSEKGITYPGTGLTDDYECWELNPCPLQNKNKNKTKKKGPYSASGYTKTSSGLDLA